MYGFRAKNLDLGQISDSGQTFRWREISAGTFEIPALGRRLLITQKDDLFQAECDEDEWKEVWEPYFDLSFDYEGVGKLIMSSQDEYLKSAFKSGSGIRILRQDLWEMIITFMISQNNNIPRIRGSVEKLCERCTVDGHFPKAEEMDPDIFDDRSLGLGYRAPYLREMCIYAAGHPGLADELKAMEYEEAKQKLLSFKGIGEKVANCVLLFGLHHVDAFPVDTHIRKILSEHYPEGFPLEKYKGCAGIVQQYMFYADLGAKAKQGAGK